MYGNKRSEMWGDLRDWLKVGSIPEDKHLKTDLISPMMKPDSKGAIFLESKKDMKSRGLASPDAADAIALTFAFPVATKENLERAAAARSKQQDLYYRANIGATNWMGA